MDVRLNWTDCDEAGDYIVPKVLSRRDLVSGPGKMDETILHRYFMFRMYCIMYMYITSKPFLTLMSVQLGRLM